MPGPKNFPPPTLPISDKDRMFCSIADFFIALTSLIRKAENHLYPSRGKKET